jgi:CDK inhibitor PHO81
MGCRKILKKWDKRSKSSTKELYLARQVDVQPVFNRQVRIRSWGIVHSLELALLAHFRAVRHCSIMPLGFD